MTNWNGLTFAQQEALHAEQIDLEIKAIDASIRRYKEQLAESKPSLMPPVQRAIAEAISDVAEAIEKKLKQWTDGEAMRGAAFWGLPFLSIPAERLALITLSVIFDSTRLPKSPSFSHLSSIIGEKVESEYHFLLLRQEAPALKKIVERRTKNWTAARVRYALKKADGLYKYWPAKHKRWVGVTLLEVALDVVDFVVCRKVKSGRKFAVHTLELTEEMNKRLLADHDDIAILNPPCLPMVVPPADWSEEAEGGYRYHKRPFVKSLIGSVTEPQAHSKRVYNVVNTIQRTPWRINKKIMEIVQVCWDADSGLWPEIPCKNQMPHYREIEAYPENAPDEVKREWRTKAAQVHDLNARLIGWRMTFMSHLSIARQMSKYEAIYFPCQLDFRGRIYSMPQPLQPQGCDLSRGLLEFAQGRPIGRDGMDWLMIQLANCFGEDKIPLASRISWAVERIGYICETADNPLDHVWWVDADKPWQALACILDIAAAWRLGDGMYNYVSHLPVQVDGSNSGLQHFSAMLRDEEGGRLTNLTPSEQPEDIYAKLSRWVTQEVEADYAGRLAQGDKESQLENLPVAWWRGRIDRKTLKRSTMTYVYGVTQQGVENYLMADGHTDGAPSAYKAAAYLRKIIWEGLQKNVKAAATAMDWLRACAKVAADKNQAICWRTPIGFNVVQEYLEPDLVRITTLDRSVHYRDPGKVYQISEYKQKNSLPPNFVHSMDACHLMMTVDAGQATGIDHWSVIHDSFGTHACNMPLLNRVLRERFVALYTGDLLSDVKQDWERQLEAELPDLPPYGNLDIEAIKDSTYMFA